MSNGYKFIIAVVGGIALLVTLSIGAYFGSLYAPDHKQYQTTAGNQRGQSDYQGPSKSLPYISGLPSPIERAIANPRPTTGEDHEKRDLAAQEASALWAFYMTVAALASVLITAVGTAFLYKQIVLTREAVEDTGKATEAMHRQNEIAERTARFQLRAYVGIGDQGAKIVKRTDWDTPESGPHFKISIVIQNFGQTPAQNVRIWMAHELRTHPTSIVSFPDIGAYRKIFDISPGDHTTQVYVLIIPDDHQAMIMDSTAALYWYVSVKYDDIFGFPHNLRLGLHSFEKPFRENEFSTLNELYFSD